jgi:hypothetical protein
MHKKRAKAQKLRKFVTMCPLGTAREQSRSPLFAYDTQRAQCYRSQTARHTQLPKLGGIENGGTIGVFAHH